MNAACMQACRRSKIKNKPLRFLWKAAWLSYRYRPRYIEHFHGGGGGHKIVQLTLSLTKSICVRHLSYILRVDHFVYHLLFLYSNYQNTKMNHEIPKDFIHLYPLPPLSFATFILCHLYPLPPLSFATFILCHLYPLPPLSFWHLYRK